MTHAPNLDSPHVALCIADVLAVLPGTTRAQIEFDLDLYGRNLERWAVDAVGTIALRRILDQIGVEYFAGSPKEELVSQWLGSRGAPVTKVRIRPRTHYRRIDEVVKQADTNPELFECTVFAAEELRRLLRVLVWYYLRSIDGIDEFQTYWRKRFETADAPSNFSDVDHFFERLTIAEMTAMLRDLPICLCNPFTRAAAESTNVINENTSATLQLIDQIVELRRHSPDAACAMNATFYDHVRALLQQWDLNDGAREHPPRIIPRGVQIDLKTETDDIDGFDEDKNFLKALLVPQSLRDRGSYDGTAVVTSFERESVYCDRLESPPMGEHWDTVVDLRLMDSLWVQSVIASKILEIPPGGVTRLIKAGALESNGKSGQDLRVWWPSIARKRKHDADEKRSRGRSEGGRTTADMKRAVKKPRKRR